MMSLLTTIYNNIHSSIKDVQTHQNRAIEAGKRPTLTNASRKIKLN